MYYKIREFNQMFSWSLIFGFDGISWFCPCNFTAMLGDDEFHPHMRSRAWLPWNNCASIKISFIWKITVAQLGYISIPPLSWKVDNLVQISVTQLCSAMSLGDKDPNSFWPPLCLPCGEGISVEIGFYHNQVIYFIIIFIIFDHNFWSYLFYHNFYNFFIIIFYHI